jgi:hypothetical protein
MQTILTLLAAEIRGRSRVILTEPEPHNFGMHKFFNAGVSEQEPYQYFYPEPFKLGAIGLPLPFLSSRCNILYY